MLCSNKNWIAYIVGNDMWHEFPDVIIIFGFTGNLFKERKI